MEKIDTDKIVAAILASGLCAGKPGGLDTASEAYGKGEIQLDHPDKKASKHHIRYAPSYVPGLDATGTCLLHPYTVDTLGKFLGWIVQKNDGGEFGRMKVETVLAAWHDKMNKRNSIELPGGGGELNWNDFRILPNED